MQMSLVTLSQSAAIGSFSLLMSACAPGGYGVIPKSGFVPDVRTAVYVAEAVMVPIYGVEAVRAERPFKAQLVDGIWHVTGSMPPAAKGAESIGGVAEVEIDRRRGTIKRITHGM